MEHLINKKLLIIGGAFQHCKLVETAKDMGVITYVTDYLPLEDAPAKQIADHFAMYNITDIDEIVEFCRQEKIDGVISTSLDACQKPYQQVCEILGLPCFGNQKQFEILTDKRIFKEYCRKNGVDVIPEYDEQAFADKATCESTVSFPILIKPCDSRGSRGQSICHSYDEAVNAIDFAKSESSSGKIVIEKYMGQNNDFSMTILMLNGNACAFRTVDRILGKLEDGLDKLAVGSVSPSSFTDLYIKNVHQRVEALYRDIGLYNAPVFMQGFVDGDTVRFYDPGLRLPGGEYERMFRTACDKDPLRPLVEFALTGNISEDAFLPADEDVYLSKKTAVQVLPTLRPGKIGAIRGMEKIKAHPCVVSVFERYHTGSIIPNSHNVNQRFCEIDVVCESDREAASVVDWIYETLEILDEKGNDMQVSRFDTAKIISGNATAALP